MNAKKEPLREVEDIAVFGIGAISYFPQMQQGKPYTRPNGKNSSSNYGEQIRVMTVSDGARYPGNVLRYSKVERPQHPTQKPLALLEYLIRTYTNEGDTVLDFTMGSGTTGHACANTGRNFIGIERDTTYFAIAQERIAAAYAPLAAMERAS